MGFGGISIWQLLIVLLIVILLFGTKKMRNIGSDLGSAIKNFRASMRDGEERSEKGEDETPAKLSQEGKADAAAGGHEVGAKEAHKS